MDGEASDSVESDGCPATTVGSWHYCWDGAATGLVATLSPIPHGKVDENVNVLRPRAARTPVHLAWVPSLCCVDPVVILLRGAHHTRRGHHRGHHRDTSKDASIPGAWIAGGRKIPWGPWLGAWGEEVFRAVRSEETSPCSDQRFVLRCFLTLER